MILQAVASITTALTLVTASLPRATDGADRRGPAPTFENDPDVTPAQVIQNFRHTNELLLQVEEAAQSLDEDRAQRLEPVLGLLEEQLGEAAHQLNVVDGLKGHVSIEVYEGINADIVSVANDLKSLSSVIVASDYL